MATPKPQGTDVSVILNQMWHTATSAYQSTVPLATASQIQDVGEAVLAAPQAIKNEFMESLYNKIGLTLVEYPIVNNHLSFLKKGNLEYGQTIEDLYVGLATSEPYVTGMSDGQYADPFAINKLPHRSAFYHTILSRQYHVTRHLTDLRKAFHGADSMEQFIGGMMNAITSRENYDDYRMTVALMARQIEEATTSTNHKGRVKLVTLFNDTVDTAEQVTAENAFTSDKFLQFFTNQLKKASERMTYLRKDFNIAGVENLTPQANQRIMMPGEILVDFDTQLLAWAYNGSLLEIGGVDKIDSWYSIGAEAEDAEGIVVTPEDIQVKATFTEDGVQCVGIIYDPGMAKIYNKEHVPSTEANNRSNYWNNFLAVEDIYAASPYKNFIYFTLD